MVVGLKEEGRRRNRERTLGRVNEWRKEGKRERLRLKPDKAD